MKIPRRDLLIIRSIANEFIRDLPKNKELDPHEFTTLCWIKAISSRLNLNLNVELPTRQKEEK